MSLGSAADKSAKCESGGQMRLSTHNSPKPTKQGLTAAS